ncbi:MAG TPA: transglutaminase-like domain-containing protein [Accumulibacter sp.]|nr:transglutaminase-like domain-containing protein [Accumulibacter sp.]HMW18247.1 transglutaminase-like domain-containing protein [Accumulibacter sp.]HMX23114.1 transglutaminase-like domain-containing protein [Accumulibacter sp.]HMY06967.1 transglutaminase-like domain-containing protein [Accumulibacter sp.]HNC16912.1 transglutaminase-like domain-containing protein [Accumulibacter sp.]
MKRRAFLAASALFSLLSPSAVWAARKKKTETAAPARSSNKSSERSANRSTGKGSARNRGGTRVEAERGERSSRRESRRERKKNASRRERAAAVEREVVERHTAPASPPPTLSDPRPAFSLSEEMAANWRTYELVSSVAINEVRGKLRVWLPLAQFRDTSWQRSLGHTWQGNFNNAGIYRDPLSDLEVFYADWQDAGSSKPQLQIVSQVARQDRHFDITRRGGGGERNEVLRRCLQATAWLPIDGLVKQTAERAIGRIKDPVAQGKAIYDWVVDNTSYDPQAPGIGRGDIEAMLDSHRLSGKSADIALLFVALCRSMGIPARPVFGLRVDSSRLFGGLGATGNLRNSQHCRAEFYNPSYGWIPVDPCDVRKSIHDEGLTGGDAKLVVLRKLLFGFWEMNWIAFNAALDVRLQGGNDRPLPFMILPQAEAGGSRFDSNDASRLTYTVNASRSAF